ncbi:MAG: response regulator [Sphingomonas bacterium]|nr:response regulator [Sphingomonas bacterium]
MTRILYVDDDADICEVALMALELDDALAVRACKSGADALAVAPEFQPALILLDVMMPQMDGPTTLAELRADERTAEIPIVFITARTQTAEVERLTALGAIGVIPKPFDPMTLADQVRTFLARG